MESVQSGIDAFFERIPRWRFVDAATVVVNDDYILGVCGIGSEFKDRVYDSTSHRVEVICARFYVQKVSKSAAEPRE